MHNIILASKSRVRREILEKNGIDCIVENSNLDEDPIKESLIKEGASPELISKNLAELKANKVSEKKQDRLVLGADSVIDLDGKIISKPTDRKDAFNILKKLNGKKHYLISSICLSKNGSMIWNCTDKATLTISAEDGGKINILKQIEQTIPVGEVICHIDTSVKSTEKKNSKTPPPKEPSLA